MKIFISSIISGFEPFRAAARSAVLTLRHEPVMAEDLGAAPHSPQIACLSGLRSSDCVVLILGEDYGPVQSGSGLSATHEEYEEARTRKPVIAFVKQGISPTAPQSAFIEQVQGWEGGLFRGSFSTPDELQAGIIRALHDYELAQAVAPVDPVSLLDRAESLLPQRNGNDGYNREAMLCVAVVGGPLQKVLRPVQIEARDLREYLHQVGLFGPARIFSATKGVDTSVQDSAIVLEQERGARFQMFEEGSISLGLPLSNTEAGVRSSGFPVLIEEVVQQQLATAIAYCGMVFEHIDPTQRLTHVAIACRIDAGEHMSWRTQAEDAASPNSGRIGMGSGTGREAVTLSQTRAALRLNTTTIVEDLLVPLRRQWKAP